MPTDSSVQPTQSTLQETSRTAESESGSCEPGDNGLKDEAHEQNDNWEWSDELTEYISNEISGKSLMVCAGLKPLCDYNVDIGDLGEFAESADTGFDVTDITILDQHWGRVHAPGGGFSEEIDGGMFKDDSVSCVYGRVTPAGKPYWDRYGGWAVKGDMFNLPFTDDAGFDTTVVDPPWLELSLEAREAILKEAIRVTKPTGKIIFNATFAPKSEENARGYQLRFRQDRDFWGNSSLLAFYRRTAEDMQELFEAHEYDSAHRYPNADQFKGETFHPNALSASHNTDPKLVSGQYREYCCPKCGCAELNQVREESFRINGKDSLYECYNCGYRPRKSEIEKLANELKQKSDKENVPIGEIDRIDHTPDCLTMPFEEPASKASSEALPWV